MSLAVHGAGGLAVATFALPALGFAVGSAVFERPPVRWEAVGNPDDFPNDTYLPRIVTTVPGIGEVGKTTVYVRKYKPGTDHEERDEYNTYVAITSRCMHLGCPVRYVEASERFICPCHGGVYDFEGKVSGGPPVRPLDRFYTRVRDGNVEIGPRYSLNSELKRFTPRDPGQPIDGIGQYIYPAPPDRKVTGF